MLPKDILKYAEKVKDVEAEVMKVLSAKPPAPAQPQWWPGQTLQPGRILPEPARQEMARQAQLNQQAYMEMARQAQLNQQAYMAEQPRFQQPRGTLSSSL